MVATVKVHLDVLGETQVNRHILRPARNAENPRPALLAVMRYLESVEVQQFATEGASSGHAWAANTQAWTDEKRRRGQRTEILRATDALRKGLTLPGSMYSKRLASRGTMIFGVKGAPAVYGPILMKKQVHSGEPRKPVRLTEGNRAMIVKIVKLWIMRGSVLAVKA